MKHRNVPQNPREGSTSLVSLEKALLVIMVALIVLPPFVFTGKVYQTEHFRAPKDLFCAIGILLTCGLWVWLYVEGGLGQFRDKALGLASLLFALWTLGSLTQLQDYRIGLDYVLNIFLFTAFFLLVLHTTTTVKRLRLLLLAANSTIWITVLYGFLQFYSLDPLFRPIKSYWSGHMMITGMLGNPNLFAAFVSMGVPFFIHWFLQGSSRAIKISSAIGLALTIYIIIMSYTRTALLGLGAGVAAYLLVYSWKVTHRRILKKLWPYLAVLVLAIVVIIMVNPKLRVRFTMPQRSDTVFHRLFIFKNTWNLVREHPMLGTGIGSFKIRYYDYQVAAMLRDPAEYEGTLYDVPYETHNDYLQVLAELGISGFTLLVAVIGIYFYSTVRSLRRIKSPDRLSIAAASLGAIVSVLVNGLSSFPFHIAPITLLTFLFAAAALVESRLSDGPILVAKQGNPVIKSVEVRRIVQVLTMLLVIWGIHRNVTLYRYMVVFNQGLLAFQDRDPTTAYQYLMQARDLRPERGEVAFNLGLVQGALGNLPEAVEFFKEVSYSYRDYKVHTAYAIALEALGDLAAAQQEHQRAVFFNPTNQDGMIKYLEFCLRNFATLDREPFEVLLELADDSLTKKPSQPEVSLRIAELLYNLERYDDAERYLGKTLAADGQNSRAYYNLGKIHQRRNQDSAAIQNYALAVMKDPSLKFLTTEYEKDRVRAAAKLLTQLQTPAAVSLPDRPLPPGPESESPKPSSPEPEGQ